MTSKHASLAAGRWFKLSLCEQLGNVGSEVNRAAKFFQKNDRFFEGAFFRALELLDLTLADPRRRKEQRKEIARAREVLCAAVYDPDRYDTTLADLSRYFQSFALAAALSR